MESIWLMTTEAPRFDALKRDEKTDVLIIGGGMAGILCAEALHQAGVDYALVEADRICGGITKNTTAKITLAHGLIYDKIIKKYGEAASRLYMRAQAEAMDKYRSLSEGIDCELETMDSYVYSRDSREKIKREVDALKRIGASADFVRELPLPFDVAGAVRVRDQAQFNPLKFAYALSKNLNIYENTKVIELIPEGALTNRGKITAKRIVVATHFPFINKHGSYFLKMYQHRSYVLVSKGAQLLNGMYVDENDQGMSFRNYKNLLLLGGGGHRTGKNGGNWRELEEFAKENYPDSREVCRYATQDCITLDGIPYIGHYSAGTPDLYVATGFNKWGITSSMVAATVLCDMIKGNKNKYAEVFSPSRSILHPQLLVNGIESILNLITPTAPRCPHLGCALKYNKAEHSWDCPCHGSRFTASGELIDNPATDDKKM